MAPDCRSWDTTDEVFHFPTAILHWAHFDHALLIASAREHTLTSKRQGHQYEEPRQRAQMRIALKHKSLPGSKILYQGTSPRRLCASTFEAVNPSSHAPGTSQRYLDTLKKCQFNHKSRRAMQYYPSLDVAHLCGKKR